MNNSAPDSDNHPYSLASSYYGPGALWCWYFTIASVTITWTVPPRTPLRNKKLTLDLIAAVLYPVIAAGHFLRQLARFPVDKTAELIDGIDEITTPNPIHQLHLTNDSALRQKIISINAPLRVCNIFVVLSLPSTLFLLVMFYSPSMRHLLKKPVFWTLPVTSLWVPLIFLFYIIKCFGTRLVETIILSQMMLGTFAVLTILICGAAVGLLVLATIFLCCVVLVFLILAKHGWGMMLHKFFESWVTYIVGFIGFILVGLMLVVCLVHPVPITWDLRHVMFPDVGVSIGEIDQAAALVVGIITFLFSLWEKFSARRKIQDALVKLRRLTRQFVNDLLL